MKYPRFRFDYIDRACVTDVIVGPRAPRAVFERVADALGGLGIPTRRLEVDGYRLKV